jgi:hypothetical protein
MTRLFTSEIEKDLMALLEMLQSFLTMLARDLAVSLFAMVHRFAEMTDALTDMGIGTFLFGSIGMRKGLLGMLRRFTGMSHFSMSFCLTGMPNRFMQMFIGFRQCDSRNRQKAQYSNTTDNSNECRNFNDHAFPPLINKLPPFTSPFPHGTPHSIF